MPLVRFTFLALVYRKKACENLSAVPTTASGAAMRRCHRLSRAQRKAVSAGADELMDRLRWVYRDHPRALVNAKNEYVALCLRFDRRIRRHYQEGNS